MNTNYTTDVYKRIMKTMNAPKPEVKSKGLLTRNMDTKKTSTSQAEPIAIIKEYVNAIQEERGNIGNG
jgi:hypothetical protein